MLYNISTMKTDASRLSLVVIIAIVFGITVAAIGAFELADAQTNKTKGTGTNATNNKDIGTASQIENLTKGNTALLENGSNNASPPGITKGLEKEQTSDTGGKMTAADKTAGQKSSGQNATSQNATSQKSSGQNATSQNATSQNATSQKSSGQNATSQNATSQKSSGQNATNASTTSANNTAAKGNNTSSQNKSGNPLSNIPVIGKLFK
jgi:type IV secretory pathway VirB10-like protein